jgi:hypothetical protein
VFWGKYVMLTRPFATYLRWNEHIKRIQRFEQSSNLVFPLENYAEIREILGEFQLLFIEITNPLRAELEEFLRDTAAAVREDLIYQYLKAYTFEILKASLDSRDRPVLAEFYTLLRNTLYPEPALAAVAETLQTRFFYQIDEKIKENFLTYQKLIGVLAEASILRELKRKYIEGNDEFNISLLPLFKNSAIKKEIEGMLSRATSVMAHDETTLRELPRVTCMLRLSLLGKTPSAPSSPTSDVSSPASFSSSPELTTSTPSSPTATALASPSSLTRKLSALFKESNPRRRSNSESNNEKSRSASLPTIINST